MDFAHSDKVEGLRGHLLSIMRDHMLPANRDWLAIARQELKQAKANFGRTADFIGPPPPRRLDAGQCGLSTLRLVCPPRPPLTLT
jgi:hypothetical protein